ncbi:MAG TPA: DUF3106 domain-containing protein [Burkholderiaceae bacterium]
MGILATVPVLIALFWSLPSHAASPQPAPPASVPAPAKAEVRPLWSELTPMQKDVLGPLAAQWPQFDSNHKAKWLAISNKYPSLPPEKQQKFKESIADWAKLTPEQHRVARENYVRAKKLDADQKAEQWQQYQQLPEEQKKKLAEDAAAKKRIANLPSLQAKSRTVEPLKAPKKQAAPQAGAPKPVPNTTPAAPVPVASPPVQAPPTAPAATK